MKNCLAKIWNFLHKFYLKVKRLKLTNKATNNQEYNYLTFISVLITKSPFAAIISIGSVFLIYLYSLKLFALSDLFLINKNFFTEESLELKLWEGLFIFTDSFGTINLFYLLLLLASILITITFPIYLAYVIKGDKNKKSHTILAKIISYFGITYVATALFVSSLFILFNTSSLISKSIQKKYINEHSFCKILFNESNNLGFIVIAEKSNVPYKLLFSESKIYYIQPNEESFIWREYNDKELTTMESLCLSLGNKKSTENN